MFEVAYIWLDMEIDRRDDEAIGRIGMSGAHKPILLPELSPTVHFHLLAVSADAPGTTVRVPYCCTQNTYSG